jgi:DNA replication protein DnaC
MAYDVSIIEAVDEEFRRRREDSMAALERRRAEAYKKDPKIRAVDAELSRKYRELITSAFGGKAPSKKETRAIAVDHLATRAELLVQAGFPVDYLELKYHCSKCSDEGFIQGKMCSCYRKALNKEAAGRTKLARLMEDQTFKSFKLDLYPEGAARKNMERIYNKVKDYAENFSSKSGNLLFTGGTGVGKTFLSSAVARHVIDKGFSVVYDSISNIVNEFEAVKFNKAQIDLSKYDICDLLIIDDLGTEMITQFSESVVYTLLNNRINMRKPMIVSTNINADSVGDLYSQSVVSRLAGEFLVLPFKGNDIRLIRKK